GEGAVAPPPRRRPAWRHALRALAWMVALVAVLAAAGWWLAESAWLAEEVRRGAATRLSEYLERPVAIGGLQLHVMPLQLEVRDLVIGSDRPGGVPFARVARAFVEADLAGLRNPLLTLRAVDVEGA